MAELSVIEVDGYEQVAHWLDEDAGLEAICAIHSTARGPAIGGTRWQPFEDTEAALSDVLRLSQAMTLKSSAARLPFGGGKAVVIGDPAAKSEAQLHSYAQFVDQFEGRYLTTTDVGTTTAEIDQLSQWTPHVVGTSGGSGDTSELTSVTVLEGIYATLEALDGDPDPAGRTIVVLGVGKVGSKVARSLAAAGAQVYVADIRAFAAAPTRRRDRRADGVGRRVVHRPLRRLLAQRIGRDSRRGDDPRAAVPRRLRRGQQPARPRP